MNDDDNHLILMIGWVSFNFKESFSSAINTNATNNNTNNNNV